MINLDMEAQTLVMVILEWVHKDKDNSVSQALTNLVLANQALSNQAMSSQAMSSQALDSKISASQEWVAVTWATILT